MNGQWLIPKSKNNVKYFGIDEKVLTLPMLTAPRRSPATGYESGVDKTF